MGVAAAEESALEARIIESYRRTRSSVKTAAELSTNESRVYRVLKAHGVEMNPKGWNEKSATTDRAAVIRFYEQCRNQSQTAEHFGISRGFVRKILREHAIDFHSRATRPEITADVVLRTYKRTRSQPKAAAVLGVGLGTVQRRLDSLAVERTNHRHWREDELARLEQGYASARNCGRLEEFAEELGRPLSTVMVKAAERGLTDQAAPKLWLRTWSAMSDEELRAMLTRFVESGLCVADFAEREGIPADSFARAMRERFRDEWEAAVASRTAPWQTISDDELRSLFDRFAESGLTLAEFAARESISSGSFARAMRERFRDEWEAAIASRVAPWQAISDHELRSLFDRFAESGLTLAEFAARESISKYSFARAMRTRLPDAWEAVRFKRRWKEMSLEQHRSLFDRYCASDLTVDQFADREGFDTVSFARAMRSRFRDEWDAEVRRRRAPWKSMTNAELRELLGRFSASGLTVGQFASREGFNRDSFAGEMRRRFPGEWENALTKAARAGDSSFGAGINVEYAVVRLLRSRGFDCYVSPGSRGTVDVFAVSPHGDTFGIQSKASGRLNPAEWNALIEHCAKTGATPLLAANPSGGTLEFYRLTGKKSEGRRGRQPCEQVWLTDGGEFSAEHADQSAPRDAAA
jgi:Holliday junction resolvase